MILTIKQTKSARWFIGLGNGNCLQILCELGFICKGCGKIYGFSLIKFTGLPLHLSSQPLASGLR